MKILMSVKKIADIIEFLLKILVIVSLGGIVAVVNISVFFRYVLNAPLSWTNELARYLLVFTVVFAASIALRHNMFVNVKVIKDLLPVLASRIITVITYLLIGGFLILCVFSPLAMIERAIRTSTISPALGIPMVVLYRMLQFGFGIMVCFLIFGIIDRILVKWTVGGKKEEMT